MRSDRLTQGSLVFFDTETTGLNVTEDAIVELGAAIFVDGRYRRSRVERFRPHLPISLEASRVHRITDADVAHCPSLCACTWLVPLLQVERLGGYNIHAYDGPLVQTEVKRHFGLEVPTPYGIDVLLLARWLFRGLRGRKLTELALHLRVELAESEAHGAGADARATGEILFTLIARELLPDSWRGILEFQEQIRPQLAEEWDLYRYWLYRDRRDQALLRLGCGKHVATPLDRLVDADFLRWASQLPDVPPAARVLFAQRLGQLLSRTRPHRAAEGRA